MTYDFKPFGILACKDNNFIFFPQATKASLCFKM